MVQELYIQFVNVNGIHTPCVKELVGVFEEIHTGSDGKESTCNAGDLGSIPGLGRSLENGTTTHSSILTCKIPWTKESGRLSSLELRRVRHN